jgi:hypothetical protein
LKDRDFLILLPINTEIEVQDYFIDKTTKEVTVPLNLSFCKVKNIPLLLIPLYLWIRINSISFGFAPLEKGDIFNHLEWEANLKK